MLKLYNPHMVFLMETKLDDKRIEKVRRRGFSNEIEVSAIGSCGDICSGQKANILVTLQSFSKYHILM